MKKPLKKKLEVTESKPKQSEGIKEPKQKVEHKIKKVPVLDNAIDIYEEIKKLSTESEEVPEEDNRSKDFGVEDQSPELPTQDMEERLEYANAQIESIMNIIAEIVDTIEVTDDVTEESR